ncbi:MAG: DUF4333 domain-containing protein [Propionibacteriaceae bacterium]|jgi:hypothetical protein|nr:DUF4333 domain-containing protein [Propionibacteriaceae bacterium]
MRIRWAAALALGLMALTACGQPTGADIAEDLTGQLVKQVPDLDGKVHVDCGEDTVLVEEGAELVCDLTVDGQDGVYDLTVTITQVDGRRYYYTYEVADKPRE